MNYAKINYTDIANGIGIRVSVFVSGCTIKCKNCFNKEAQDFKYGKQFTSDELNSIINQLSNSYISGITILGGEPFEISNQYGVLDITNKVREVFGNKKSIWIYSGYILDRDLVPNGKRYKNNLTDCILDNIDVLVDGPFIEELKDLRLQFRGSSNQRVIDMNYWKSNREIKLIY